MMGYQPRTRPEYLHPHISAVAAAHEDEAPRLCGEGEIMDSHTLRLVALSFSPWHRAYAAREAEYEREVLQMMCILPGTHRYAAVEAALNAAGVRPRDIYESLAAEPRTLALARFYEALGLVD